jgi:hypothetical protein
VRTGDGWSVRETAKAKADSVLGQARRLRVTVYGSNVAAYLDGEPVIETAFALDRERGCVGLGLSGGTVRFDDFSVKHLPDTPPLTKTRSAAAKSSASRLVRGVPREHAAGREDGRAGRPTDEFDVRPPRWRGRAAATRR